MKVTFAKIKSIITIQFILILVLIFTGCKSVDNFDDFSIFGNENAKAGNGFRIYSDNNLNSPVVEFVLDVKIPESIEVNLELKKTCDYAKIPYEAIDLIRWDSASTIRPSVRVICIASTKKLSDRSIDKIIEFVAKGGTLFMPFSASDIRISYLLGFKPEAEYENDIKVKGFHFNTPFLPGLANFDIRKNVKLFGFAKENFSNNIKVLVKGASNQNFPAVIINEIGAGRVILINGQTSFEKRDRGFAFAPVLVGLEGIPYPIANTSTIFLDDFPCPLFNIKAEPIASEMNLGQTDYVKKVWWPDMKRLAKKYNISYSAMLVFDYKNRVEPPFTFDQWDLNKVKSEKGTVPLSEYFVHDAAKNGHELAFHGYNHVEYLGDLWKNQDFVGTALNSVKKKWDLSNFGKLPVTYVPPSNYIDDRGIDKLQKEMPSIKYLCSSYNGETREGENREFDYDPYNKDFFDYPRITYGFYLDEEKRYNQQSAYLYTGIWTHFVHPDDVYQIPAHKNKTAGDFELRNALSLGWYKTNGQNRGLFFEFDKYLKQMKTNFPQVRFLNAGEAANIVLDWRASNFKHSTNNGIYSVEEINPEQSISGNQYWFLYVSTKNCKKMESAFKKQVVRFSKTPFLEGYLYSLYTNKSKLSLPDLNYKSNSEELKMTVNKIKNDYKDYQRKVFQFHNGNENWFDDAEIKFKRELDSLKSKMLTEVKIDSTTWNRYTKYMLWEDKGAEVWTLFEEHCKKNPLPENFLYSYEMSKFNDFPNDIIREKWLYKLLELMPTDKKIIQAYIDSFNTPENKEKMKIVYEHLLLQDHSFDTYLQYLQFLLLYDPKSVLCDLNEITPSENYKSIATEICWIYADDNQLKKAYEWSLFSSEIDFTTKISWLLDLKSFDLLENEYNKYIASNASDYKAKAIMCEYYHYTGKFEEAWILANSLPESPEKESVKSMLNKDVKYVEVKIQENLINDYPEFFEKSIKDELIKTNRLEGGNFWAYNNSLESNRQYLSCFKNVLSYNFYNKNTSLNGIAVTYSKMYNLRYDVNDPDNVSHNVYGVQYQYNSTKVNEKWKYWSKARAEYSDYDSYYFHFGIGANLSKDKRFTSAEIKIFPAENGPCYSKNIYRMQSNFYNDVSLFNKINTTLSIEGNYYTKSKTNSSVTTNSSFEGTITGKAVWDKGVAKKSKWLPFVEISYLHSNIGDSTLDLSAGYPYWMIDQRFYSGGGLGWKFTKTDFTTQLESGWFYDTYSDDFKRFIGNLTYQIFDYTAITTNFEMYIQSKFYSNVIQFGVKYNMKKKHRK